MGTRNAAESPVSLDVIIIGAGLAGLSAAISIALARHKVTILESARELAEVGAGLQLTPNGTRILQAWRLPESFWAAAAEPKTLEVHRYSGEVLATEREFDTNIRRKYGAPFLDMHRVDLQRALHGRALELGVDVRLGQRVQDVDFEQAQLTTEAGETFRGDLIVAADGLWSRSRTLFDKTAEGPRPTGDLAYRVVLHIDQLEDQELRSWVSNPAVHFWIGPGAHAVGYSMRAGTMYNVVLLVPDDLPEGVSRRSGSVAEMRALFDEWDPILGRFLAIVDGVDKWKLMHIDEMPQWVTPSSRVVFMGDACHPMLPYLAQGANSAVEDAAVLGSILGHIQSRDELPQALQTYQRLRKTRGDTIVKETFAQRKAFHMPDGPEQEARDEVFLSQLGKPLRGPFPSRWTCPAVQPWLYGYDAFEEVEQALAKSPLSMRKQSL